MEDRPHQGGLAKIHHSQVETPIICTINKAMPLSRVSLMDSGGNKDLPLQVEISMEINFIVDGVDLHSGGDVVLELEEEDVALDLDHGEGEVISLFSAIFVGTYLLGTQLSKLQAVKV